MISRTLPSVLLTGALLAAAGMALPAAAQAAAAISVRIGPPAAPVELVPAPRPGWVWAPGHYEWRAERYHWRPGHWVRARPGYEYVAPRWRADRGRWIYVPARWEPRRMRPGWRDRDHDGMPDRRDRAPRNPYRY